MLKFLTAGESHGLALTAILEGIPAGLKISAEYINRELARRQRGFGRSERMSIERDEIEITSGLWAGEALGSPLTLVIKNKDWRPEEFQGLTPKVTVPRPGHADLTGALKYGYWDLKPVAERSSARETAVRVAIGAIVKSLLKEFGIEIVSHVVNIGGIWAKTEGVSIEEIAKRAEDSPLRCSDGKVERGMTAAIEQARVKGDSLGGVFEVIALNVPPGLGSFVHWDRRLDGRLAQAVMSIPGIKGVEMGLGFRAANLPGSQVHDEIFYQRQATDNRRQGFYRKTNNAGGIEGGVSNGEPIVVRAAMKPISTLRSPLRSVDLLTKEEGRARVERADICAVPAASIVGEAMVAWEIAQAMLEKFGGDSLREMKRNHEGYLKQLREMDEGEGKEKRWKGKR